MYRAITITLVWFVAAGTAFADQAAGKVVFDKSCRNCHGVVGQGNPSVAKIMKVKMRHLGSLEIQAKSDGDLRMVIVDGVGKMKPVSRLSAQQVKDVIAFVRTLKE